MSKAGRSGSVILETQEIIHEKRRRNFEPVIEKATKACENAGADPSNHFPHTPKMVELGSGAERGIDDIMLSRGHQESRTTSAV